VEIGAGSGGWAIEVAREFPNSEITGTDISPVDRTDVPQNCRFVIGDANDGLDFEDNSVDLVHAR
jgi:metalloendopeptidase OMA1, mitochondrial